MKQQIKKATTGLILPIFVQDSSQTDGRGLAGLVFNSAGLTWYYRRPNGGDAGGVQVTLVTATRGTYTSGGFVEIDATNMPGFYEIGVPAAVLASGADWVTMMLRGAANMAPVTIEIQLVDKFWNDLAEVDAQKNVALTIDFPMLSAGGDPVTGLTPTVQISKDGAAFAASTNTATEIGNGMYQIVLTAAEMNADRVIVRATGTGAKDMLFSMHTKA